MFELVSDVERYPEFLPLCERLVVHSRRRTDNALEEIVALYGGAPLPVEHSRCVARGDELCEWTARPEAPA